MKPQIKAAYIDWIGDAFEGRKMLAFTLNFKQRHDGVELTKEIALGTVRRFHKGLSRRAYGPRSSCRKDPAKLQFAAVHEGVIPREHAARQFHFHGVIEVPKGRTIHAWESECETAWDSLVWADQGSLDFKRYRDKGWIDYMLKFRSKEDLEESIDLTLLQLRSFRDA